MSAARNVLLITTDQHHFSALGRVNPELETPHLDRLAAEGVAVERAYCPNPLCSPSRSSLITGQYPSQHGCWTLGTKLDEDATTLPGLLSAEGYDTSLVGKAHFQPLASTPDQQSLECLPTLRDLDFWRDFTGPWYGFDHIALARNHGDERWIGQHYAIWLEEHGLTDWPDYFQALDGTGGRTGRWELPAELHYTTWTGERTCAQLDRAAEQDRPFFAWASFHDPHPPYLVSDPWADRYRPEDMSLPDTDASDLERMHAWFAETQRAEPDFSRWTRGPYPVHGFGPQATDPDTLRRNTAIYYGMVSFVDAQVGRILARLAELGLADDTLVIFTTDHGHFLGQHGLTAKGPFHYEDLVKIPFLARLPGVIPAGSTTSNLTSLIDLAPTILAATGHRVPLDMQGVDQLDAWSGGTAARDHVIVENRFDPPHVHIETLVTDRHKLTVYRGADHRELFDLEADPDERVNLAGEPAAADLEHQMLARLVDAHLGNEVSPYERIAIA